MATIGQSPRDDLVPYMQEVFTKPVEILQKGCLDGLRLQEIVSSFGPEPGEVGLVARLRDGSSTLISQDRLLPKMQMVVDELSTQGCEFVVVLCAADWSAIKSSRLVINPGKVFTAIVSSLAVGRRLGVIQPSAGQVDKERERYSSTTIEAVVTSANPYSEARLDAVREAANYLKSHDVDLVWMSCVGMDAPMQAVVQEVVGKPIIFARTILSRIIDELVPNPL